MFCRSCGKEIPDGSAKCPACGVSQTITEREYQTGARSPMGAAFRRFQREPAVRRVKLVLEGIGLLAGIGADAFALLVPGELMQRAILVLLGTCAALGFGILLCHTLEQRSGSEV